MDEKHSLRITARQKSLPLYLRTLKSNSLLITDFFGVSKGQIKKLNWASTLIDNGPTDLDAMYSTCK